MTFRVPALVVAGVMLAAGCMREAPLEWPAREPGSQRGGVLRLAAADDVPTLDPALSYDSRSWTYQQHLFETLVTYDEESRIVPLLAERWTVSDDLRQYRFELRPGVVFSDGTPVTAADAAGSIARVIDPKTRSQGAEYYRGIRGAAAYTDGTAPDVAGMQAPDATTLTIELDEPDPLFLDKMRCSSRRSFPSSTRAASATTSPTGRSAAARSCCASGGAASASCWRGTRAIGEPIGRCSTASSRNRASAASSGG